MKLAQFSVNKPVTTVMIFAASVVLGLTSLLFLGLDLLPEIEVPAVSVLTAYEGAGPEEIETLITEPLEDALSTISGVDEVVSVSKEGLSAVTLKFKWGEKIDEVINDVRDKIDQAEMRIPEEAEKPVIVKFDLAMQPIMVIVVTATDSYADLRTIVKDNITDPLKRVKGVAAATERGGLVRQIRIDLDRDRMAALNLTVAQVNAVLAAQNISSPGGNIKTGYKNYLLRTPEEFENAAEVAEVIVTTRNDIPIKLKDVAKVDDLFEERTYDVSVNGQRGMAIFIQKQSGENTVQVARGVTAELENIKKTLPPDVKPNIVMDNSEFILASVYNLRDNVFWAIVFVFFVILFFLRDFRASIIVAVSIPTSLVITFLMMWLADYTINTTTLAALAVVVGMVVDNAIVVVDNIHRHHQKGQRSRESAIFGTSEVGVAVMASTLTTIAIFLPIIFVGGITEIIFGQFSVIVVMSLVASLFTAIMLVPMLCAKLLRLDDGQPKVTAFRLFYDWGEKTLVVMENVYSKFLDWSLRNRKTVLISCTLFFVGSIGLLTLIGTEFLPEEDQNMLSGSYDLPVGTRYERTGRVARQMQTIVTENVPEKKDVFVRWGVYGSAEGGVFATQEESHKGFLFVRLVDKLKRNVSPRQIIERIRPIAAKIPGAVTRFSAEDPTAAMVFGSSGKLSLELYGHNMEDALKYANDVKTALTSVEGIRDIQISREEEKPELKVVVDRDKASKLGLDARTIGKTIETFFAGTTATKYREGGEEYDVEVRLQPTDRGRIEDLQDVFIGTPYGEQIALANVATVVTGVGPTKIERKDQARYITVSADVSGRDLGSAVKDVEKALDKVQAPTGFTYKFAGAEKEKREAFRLLLVAVVLGMVLVYMVMASQFESYRDPFIIFLSVPFGITGVIIGLTITGISMSVITFLALILLIGLVVNNGIVLISFIGILRHRGLDTYSAIMEGGRSRLRPILSTTLTTLLGLAPLMFSRGSGSEIWVPFSVTSVSGLAISTLITLILMPTLYSVFEGVKIPEKQEMKK